MSFTPSFEMGDTVTNDDIINSFGCGLMGGMRRIRKTNTLVIISDHTKGLYEDKWFNDELHYTGMGKLGDQSIEIAQNKTLAESNANGVEVHLFEVLLPTQYIYRGQVFLCENPYREIQPDKVGNNRIVWMFPLKLKGSSQPITKAVFEKYKQYRQKKARRLSDEELINRAQQIYNQNVSKRQIISTNFIRDEYISEYTKRRAGGICQLCNKPAPFNDSEGTPYLECHHIEWLSQGGSDTFDNTAALCPNCHKKMHVLNLDSDKNHLKQMISSQKNYIIGTKK